MPKFVQISKDLCLVQQEVKSKKKVTKREQVNHIWIYDRSGSMWDALPELTGQLIGLSKGLPKGDTLTLGWFSGEGDFNFILKGFKIADDSDYVALEKLIKSNSSARNTTCFSEILDNTEQVLTDLSVFSKVFSLHFFTDGYPVVSNYKKEIDGIHAALKKIKGKIHTAMLVGYGVYYNKELMSQMAEKLGAVLIHSSLIPEYAHSITKLIKLAETSEPREEIDPLMTDNLAIFTVTDQGVSVYSIDEDGKVYVSPQKDQSSFVYYLSKEKPNTKSWDRVNIEDVNFADKDDKIAKGLYAAALVLTQQVKTDVALEVVGKVGDKQLVDSLNNAFTIEEYGRVEEELNKSILEIENRFNNGRDSNYLPPADAFCVFDLLNILMNDDKASFYPYHAKFSYEKIGVGSKTKGDYPKFNADENCKCAFDNLVWHSSRLNLSVQTRVNGKVDLKDVEGKKPADLGFAVSYPVYMFRNYTFIKDGRVHVKKFFISSSEQTYLTLKNKGLVIEDGFKKDGVYGVDISKLPSINRKIANGKTSATELCKMVYEEQSLKAQVKALKWLKGDLFGEESSDKVLTFTDEQKAFLEANGIDCEKGGCFAPPYEKQEATDKYMAKYFDIKIDKMASLPQVKKVVEKIEANKSRTPVETLLEGGINIYNAAKDNLSDNDVKLKWFETTIANLQKRLKEVRTKIQEIKFAVIMGKKWFDEFASRDNPQLVVDGMTFKFELGEESVDI